MRNLRNVLLKTDVDNGAQPDPRVAVKKQKK